MIDRRIGTCEICKQEDRKDLAYYLKELICDPCYMKTISLWVGKGLH